MIAMAIVGLVTMLILAGVASVVFSNPKREKSEKEMLHSMMINIRIIMWIIVSLVLSTAVFNIMLMNK